MFRKPHGVSWGCHPHSVFPGFDDMASWSPPPISFFCCLFSNVFLFPIHVTEPLPWGRHSHSVLAGFDDMAPWSPSPFFCFFCLIFFFIFFSMSLIRCHNHHSSNSKLQQQPRPPCYVFVNLFFRPVNKGNFTRSRSLTSVNS